MSQCSTKYIFENNQFLNDTEVYVILVTAQSHESQLSETNCLALRQYITHNGEQASI
jgi:hypothetical protein